MTASDPPVYFLLHIPKTAGQSIGDHLAEHCRPGIFWRPQRRRFAALLPGARRVLPPGGDQRQVRVVAGHDVARSLEALFPGREIRRVALLRHPLSLQLSLYNYRMMNHLNQGQGTYGFGLHLRSQPRDFAAHWLLARWLEIPWPALLAMSAERKYRLLNAELARFWFVGDYTDCDRLIAVLAAEFGIPAAARRRNTAEHWQRFIAWDRLDEARLTPALRDALVARNRLDLALWQSWRTAGFETAAARPRPLAAVRRFAFAGAEALRPAAALLRSWRRYGAALLRRSRGPRTGVRRADRARDAGQWRLAARHYRRALKAGADTPAIWLEYGRVLDNSGETERAQDAYRQAERRRAPDAAAQNRSGG